MCISFQTSLSELVSELVILSDAVVISFRSCAFLESRQKVRSVSISMSMSAVIGFSFIE